MTAISLFQWALAAYCSFFTTLALLNPRSNLGLLRSALRLLEGGTDYFSYANVPGEEIVIELFFLGVIALTIAVCSVVTGWGLWKLKAWARHSTMAQYGAMLLMWTRCFLNFAVGAAFSLAPSINLHPVYWVILIEATIFLTMRFHLGVAESFGEEE